MLTNNEFDFDEIMDRLKKVTNANSYNSLADALGLSSSAFANLKKRGSVPYDKIISLASSLNVSIDWVITGEGEMYRTPKDESEVTDKHSEKVLELYGALSDTQRKEILFAIEEKQQLNQLMETVQQLKLKVG